MKLAKIISLIKLVGCSVIAYVILTLREAEHYYSHSRSV